MLYFVQQFKGGWLQIREYRPNCCTFYNIELQIGVILPFLLYKIQHLLAILKNWTEPSGEFFNPAGDDR
ncbi:hypothetical protein [Paenibacillus ginsengihumi]|uniref:hypothetical protein n=1 Tax=Paenibacillus ginsengihumi TaxID=431596 RepID=UPI00035C90DC|nr:hypothetical protein [Paenibacillus ginsengihumi]